MTQKRKPEPQPEKPDAEHAGTKPRPFPAGVIAGLALVGSGLMWWLWPGKEISGARPTTQPSGTGVVMENEAAAFAQYGGSASCRECHPKEFEMWSSSNHGMAERALNPAMDRVAFDPPREIAQGPEKSEVRKNGDRCEMVTLGFGGKTEAYAAERVIGHDPLRQFLVAAPGGRLQTLEMSWDPKKQEWFDVYGSEDRKPGEWGHWTGRGMTWNTMCASCHNTRLRKNYDPVKDEFHTTMAERTVSCEACHGPMKAHD